VHHYDQYVVRFRCGFVPNDERKSGSIRETGSLYIGRYGAVSDDALPFNRVSSESVPNPLGVVAVMSAFNFPVAVYGWYASLFLSFLNQKSNTTCRNLALSFAAGNATLWKPSPSTPLCAIAVTKIVSSVLERNDIPGAVAGLVTGGNDVGAAIVESHDVDLGEITGCTRNSCH
jgi:acyl-CoA reductase-like NAD-dependent aldehyde dehydrogenase